VGVRTCVVPTWTDAPLGPDHPPEPRWQAQGRRLRRQRRRRGRGGHGGGPTEAGAAGHRGAGDRDVAPCAGDGAPAQEDAHVPHQGRGRPASAARLVSGASGSADDARIIVVFAAMELDDGGSGEHQEGAAAS
jgi:hypothetical protein